jgi:hypothetical protein
LNLGYPIKFDISQIKTLTPDAIILQIARIKDETFHKKTGIAGNAPSNPELKKLFLTRKLFCLLKWTASTMRYTVCSRL